MISFQRIDINEVDRGIFGEVNVFQTPQWLQFVAETQNAEPVVAAVMSGGSVMGYFTGLIMNKYGVRILGSPFRGWSTNFMGFNLKEGAPRREILQALPELAFGRLKCKYLEIVDPCLTANDCEGLTYDIEFLDWKTIDLRKTEDELFARMKHNGRNNIRKAIKSGVTIDEASSVAFADEYFSQVEDVFEKQSLLPPYGRDRVRQLIEYLLPTGNLLLLRAKNEEGLSIATGIFLFLNKTAVFWGAASYRSYQAVRPNELLAWHGMKQLKTVGIQELHLGGECEQYKEKLGCTEIHLPRLMKAESTVLSRVLKVVRSPRGMRYRNWALRRLDRN